MCAKCDARPIIDAVGKSVINYFDTIIPYYAGVTTSGKTIFACPIEIENAFEMCRGSGLIRSGSVKEFGTSEKLPFDIIFAGAGGYAVSTNTVTLFDASNAAGNYLQDTITIAGADYVDKGDYQEAKFNITKPISVFNKSSDEGHKKSLWFYLVARGVKTFTSDTRLVIHIAIESD